MPGTIAPGFVQRHVVHASTTIEQPPGHAIALHFALVGTLSLAVGRGGRGVLIVPDVHNLHDFIERRPLLNPREPRDCQITSPADAALQAQVRLRATEAGLVHGSSGAKESSSPAQRGTRNKRGGRGRWTSIRGVRTGPIRRCDGHRGPETEGHRGQAGEEGRAAAEVLGRGNRPILDRRECRSPSEMVQGLPGAGGRAGWQDDEQRVCHLNFEREGLQKMIDRPWEDHGEEILVRAIHQAMGQCFGKIWDESGHDQTTSQEPSRSTDGAVAARLRPRQDAR